jgi:hypothetical protein
MSIITLDKPLNCNPLLLHAEIDALNIGPYKIEWLDEQVVVSFDHEIESSDAESLEIVVDTHDASQSLNAAALEAEKIAAIQLANKALVESAKEKRLSGQQLTQAELSALVDAMLFPV